MGGYKLTVTGLDAVIAKLEPGKFNAEIKDAMDAFGLTWVKNAKELAPTDEGHLKQMINYEIDGVKGVIHISLNANTDYAAYIEFGTRKYAAKYVATLPADWRTFAAQFKGKSGGGDMNEFVQRIMAWVLRKGIGGQTTKSGNLSRSASSFDAMQSAAYAIAINILQNGVKPHPFMFPAYNIAYKQLIKDLENLIPAA